LVKYAAAHLSFQSKAPLENYEANVVFDFGFERLFVNLDKAQGYDSSRIKAKANSQDQ
jgi:hypothetical protein